MTISIVNEKGGSGKTTLAVNLAAHLALNGNGDDVLLIDTDPQRSAESFSNIRNNEDLPFLFNAMTRLGKGLAKEIQHIKPKFDYIIIDTGGRDSVEMRESMLVSDVVLVPTIPSQYDVAVFDKMCRVIEDVKVINTDLKVFLLISKASPNPSLKKKVADLQGYIKDKQLDDFTLLKSIIYEREVYRTATSYGQSISEFCKETDKALVDFLNFYKEFTKLINKKIKDVK